MKFKLLFSAVILSFAFALTSCDNNADVKNAARENLGEVTPPPATPPPAAPAATTQPKAPEPAQNAKGVWHYTCQKGCAGGAGAAGQCATCGGQLAHNAAYHN